MTRLVNPCKKPRYDDVYDKGVAALELRRDVREGAIRKFNKQVQKSIDSGISPLTCAEFIAVLRTKIKKAYDDNFGFIAHEEYIGGGSGG